MYLAVTQRISSKLSSFQSFQSKPKLLSCFDRLRGIRELSRRSQDRTNVLRPVEDFMQSAFLSSCIIIPHLSIGEFTQAANGSNGFASPYLDGANGRLIMTGISAACMIV